MRRLNVKLALWLVGIMLLLVVGVHFLHGFQLDRNAEFLRKQAEQARDGGDTKEAVKFYNQYLKYRDDPAGYSELAKLVAASAEGADATNRDRLTAYNILDEAIRRHPDLKDVRRKLIEFTMMFRRIPDTLEHIQYLKGQGDTDPELDVKIARCHILNGEEEAEIKKLSELVGYDQETQRFKPEGGPGAKQVEAFSLLAQLLRRKTDGAQQADAVMKQLVALNPDSPQAHLARAQYISMTDKMDAAKENLEQAYSLAKDDVEVMLAMAVFAMNEKD
jgi:tetratricopeptide (TPR) repeat protein